MHELWLCKSILKIIEQKAKDIKCTRVKKIILEIGQLTALEKEALIFSFNVITEGTIAENAELDILNISAKAFCESCQQVSPLQQYYDACHTCGSYALKIVQGEELRVKSMVVE